MRVDRAVVLAAGLGTRLRWLTREHPKALMPIGGMPAIEIIIRRLAAQGIRDIAINLHHHAEAIPGALGRGERLGVRLVYSHEPRLLDSGGGVRQALSLLPGEGPVVVHNADVLSDVPVQELAARLPPGGGCAALVDNPAHHPRGDFGLRQGRVVAKRRGEASYTFAGVSVFDAGLFAAWSEAVFPLAEVLSRLIGEDRLAGYHHPGQWLDIGRPRDLMRAHRFLQSLPV